MFVRQLIGSQAGKIQNQPYSAATSNIASGTCAAVTDEEVQKENPELFLEEHIDTPAEAPPAGYSVKINEEAGGYDVFAPDGSQVNKRPYPNAPAARDAARYHAEKQEKRSAAAAVQPVAEVREGTDGRFSIYIDGKRVVGKALDTRAEANRALKELTG